MALDAEIDFQEEGYEVAKVTVHAIVSFDAFVLVDENGDVHTARLASELRDAIQYHGGHLGESEEGDCLIVTTTGGSLEGVGVDVSLTACERVADFDAVNDAIAGTAAWV